MSAPHRLREIREAFRDEHGKKMSGIKMAKLLGITPQYYYDIEKGERNLSSELAAKSASILNVTIDYLLKNTNTNLYEIEKKLGIKLIDSTRVRMADLKSTNPEFFEEGTPEFELLKKHALEGPDSLISFYHSLIFSDKTKKTVPKNEHDFLEKEVDLTDEEIKKEHTFMIDGRELTEEEFQRMIAAVRADRLYRDEK